MTKANDTGSQGQPGDTQVRDQRLRRLRRQFGLAATLALPSLTAVAQAVGGVAVHGTLQQQVQGTQTTLTTTHGAGTQHTVINWSQFSVPAGHSTYFAQPGAHSTVVNRVTEAVPSVISGQLGSNGHVILVNPAGVTVAAGAVVDTAGFTATALSLSEYHARAGRWLFGGAGESGGVVQVDGHVLARQGDVTLVAPQVKTGEQALIQAPNGAVILAAGQQAEIVSRGLGGVRMLVQAPSDQAVNLGRLTADAVAMFAGSLKHSGDIQVQAVQAEGGRIELKAVATAEIDGRVQASRLQGQGGLVHATASTVRLGDKAHVDVRGPQGGGEALVGGGWQGQDARLSNAQRTDMAAGARIEADATARGQGGTVVLWADEDTRFAGHISARGGPEGGDGGRVETSGRASLTLGGQVDTRAPAGRIGRWLIDPSVLTVQGGSGETVANTVYESDLERQNTDIVLMATEAIQAVGTFSDNAIVLNPGVSISLVVDGGSTGSGISLVADGVPIALMTTGAEAAILLETKGAPGMNIVHGGLQTGGGKITVLSEGAIEHRGMDHVASDGGDIRFEARGGGITSAAVWQSAPFSLGGRAAGAIDVQAAGPLTLGDVIASPIHTYPSGDESAGSGGQVSLRTTAAGDITVGHVFTRGGDTYGMGADGGHGASLLIRAEQGNITVTGALDASGGRGYRGDGGNGGDVEIVREQGDLILKLPANGVGARGGQGGSSYEGDAGHGGQGGRIRISAKDGALVLSGATVMLDPRGGAGGSRLLGAGQGGHGGDGGDLVIDAKGDLTLQATSLIL